MVESLQPDGISGQRRRDSLEARQQRLRAMGRALSKGINKGGRPPKKRGRPPRGRPPAPMNESKLAELRITKGCTLEELARYFGVYPKTIAARLEKLGITETGLERFKAFRDDRAREYELLAYKMLDELADADWSKVTPSQLMVNLGILEDKIKAIRTKTSGVTLIAILSALDDERLKAIKALPADSSEGEVVDDHLHAEFEPE